jgi:hypothetical protein
MYIWLKSRWRVTDPNENPFRKGGPPQVCSNKISSNSAKSISQNRLHKVDAIFSECLTLESRLKVTDPNENPFCKGWPPKVHVHVCSKRISSKSARSRFLRTVYTRWICPRPMGVLARCYVKHKASHIYMWKLIIKTTQLVCMIAWNLAYGTFNHSAPPSAVSPPPNFRVSIITMVGMEDIYTIDNICLHFLL